MRRNNIYDFTGIKFSRSRDSGEFILASEAGLTVKFRQMLFSSSEAIEVALREAESGVFGGKDKNENHFSLVLIQFCFFNFQKHLVSSVLKKNRYFRCR